MEALNRNNIFSRARLNVLLFIATFFTTYYVDGVWYSVTIMTILLAHEMGHFFMCRKYGVESTMPYFLPLPFPPFGTFGAVIKMKGLIPSKKALFDIGATGPLMGLVFAIPAIFVGLHLSDVRPVPTDDSQYFGLGEPILFSFISKLVIGPLPEGIDIYLHPVAFAGWAGLFVTALNLLPIGQLDGGHVLYGLFGRSSWRISMIVLVGLGTLSLFYPGWWTLVALLLVFGVRHPRTRDETRPLDGVRIALGIFALAFFVVSFIPQPF